MLPGVGYLQRSNMASYATQKYAGAVTAVSEAGFATVADVLSAASRDLNSGAAVADITGGASLTAFLKTIDGGNATSTYQAINVYSGGDANGG